MLPKKRRHHAGRPLNYIVTSERATQSDRFFCIALSGLPRHWISTPGRRCAANAATLCPGLVYCCPCRGEEGKRLKPH